MNLYDLPMERQLYLAAREVRDVFNAMRTLKDTGEGDPTLIKEQLEEAEFHLRDVLVRYDFREAHPELFAKQEVTK